MNIPALSEITVRYPRDEDINALAAIAADVRTDTGTFEKRHQLLYREIRISRSPRKFFLVLEYRNAMAGFVRAVRSRNPFANLWWIEGLEIKPSLRRKGLGTYLLKEALFNIYHRGCRHVFLEVDRHETGIMAFYSKLRFKHASGITAFMVRLLHRNKHVLMYDLSRNEDWINRPATGFKYMGIK